MNITIDASVSFKTSKIKYPNREDIQKLNKQWFTKILKHMNSKYKSIFLERNFTHEQLSKTITKELKTVDFENVDLKVFIRSLEPKVLKELNKNHIVGVRIGYDDDLVTSEKRRRAASTKARLNDSRELYKASDHQKQQILKGQRRNNEAHNKVKQILNYESLSHHPIERIKEFREKEVDQWAMISQFNEEKYKSIINSYNKDKALKQNDIDNLLREFKSKEKLINTNDYYGQLEHETMIKLQINNAIKEKTLKDKLLSMNYVRTGLEKSYYDDREEARQFEKSFQKTYEEMKIQKEKSQEKRDKEKKLKQLELNYLKRLRDSVNVKVESKKKTLGVKDISPENKSNKNKTRVKSLNKSQLVKSHAR